MSFTAVHEYSGRFECNIKGKKSEATLVVNSLDRGLTAPSPLKVDDSDKSGYCSSMVVVDLNPLSLDLFDCDVKKKALSPPFFFFLFAISFSTARKMYQRVCSSLLFFYAVACTHIL